MFETDRQTLYKYRAFDSKCRSLKMLKKATLRFSSALTFNDPFDTSFTFDFDDLYEPIAEQWARSATEQFRPDLSPLEKEKFVASRLAKLRNDPSEAEEYRRGLIAENYKKFGICSLAGSNDNLLMWAHYAGQHTGFVVGISVARLFEYAKKLSHSKKEFIDFTRVTYQDDFPRESFFRAMLVDTFAEYTRRFISTKSVHWAYEDEHRLIYWDRTNVDVTFGHDIFESVTLGCRIAPRNERTLLAICRRYLPNATLQRAIVDDKKFALRIEPIS